MCKTGNIQLTCCIPPVLTCKSSGCTAPVTRHTAYTWLATSAQPVRTVRTHCTRTLHASMWLLTKPRFVSASCQQNLVLLALYGKHCQQKHVLLAKFADKSRVCRQHITRIRCVRTVHTVRAYRTHDRCIRQATLRTSTQAAYKQTGTVPYIW